MNKLFVTLFLMLCVVGFSFGQDGESKSYLSKGQWMAGGRMSFLANQDFENGSFSVSPMAGYFIGKKLALGLQVNYSFDNIESLSGPIEIKMSTIGASPFVRYYFGVNRIAPFAELMGGAKWSKQKRTDQSIFETETNNSSSFYSVGAGLNYFISRDVALEGVLRYTDDNGYYKGYLDFDLGLQFFFSRGSSAGVDDAGNYFAKGNWIIGGTGNVALGSLDDIDPYSFSISPMGGYLVGNKLAVGVTTGYTHIKGTADSFFAAPFMRYYFTQKRLAPYAEAAYGRSWTKIEYVDTNGPVVEKYSSSAYRFGTGLNYFLSRNVALDASIRYSRSVDADAGSWGFNAGLQFFIR